MILRKFLYRIILWIRASGINLFCEKRQDYYSRQNSQFATDIKQVNINNWNHFIRNLALHINVVNNFNNEILNTNLYPIPNLGRRCSARVCRFVFNEFCSSDWLYVSGVGKGNLGLNSWRYNFMEVKFVPKIYSLSKNNLWDKVGI